MKMKIDVNNEKKKAEIFLKRQDLVHISKSDGRFYNGKLIEVGSNFLILKDRLDGREILILFSELKNPLDKFKEVKGNEY